jgi:hypothetical protein
MSTPARRGHTCVNCGRPAPPFKRERCNACYLYQYRHGRERPLPPPRPGRRAPARPCRICGELVRYQVHGRCARCHAYWKDRQQERPRSIRGGHARPLHPCPRCGALGREWIGGHCPTCYRHILAEDAARWRPCQICGRRAYLIQARCAACYRYWRRHVRERPSALWGPPATPRGP